MRERGASGLGSRAPPEFSNSSGVSLAVRSH